MKYSFIGAGNLPEAIISAMIKKLGIKNEIICIYDEVKSQYDRYNGFNLKKSDSLAEAVNFGDIIFLTVKPQNFQTLLPQIKELNFILKEKLFVTTAAGINMDYIARAIGQDIKIIRTMPNTPIMQGEGMTALCKNELTGKDDFEAVKNIFGNLGDVMETEESMMNKVISINGSSPAYVYLFIEAMIQGAEEQGFDRKAVYEAVIKSVRGSLSMLKNSEKTPSELISAVASKGGTTEAALKSFESDGFIQIIKKAMYECSRRADELTEEFCK